MEGSPGSSPIKFLPQKKIKVHIDLLKCIICQQITKEKLCTATQTGIDCVVSASKVRQDNIWQRIEAEETSSQAKVVYHRSCYQSYTSSKNLTHAQKGKTTDHLDSTQASNEHLPTRTRTPSLADWSTCLVCNSRKRDKVHKIQTLVCQESLLTAAKSRNDIQMLGRLEGVDLIAVEAVYHGSCMASYVSKHNITGALKEEQRENTFQLAFDQLIQGIDQDLQKGTAFKMTQNTESMSDLDLLPTANTDDVLKASRQIVASLYDPKGKYKESHRNLDDLRVQLVGKDYPLHRIPPSEPSFLQHVKRACYQTRIWISAHEAQPDIPSPEGNGWHKEGTEWRPNYFEGQTAAEMLEELLCSCRGRSACANDCTCAKNDMGCTEECLCKGSEECANEFTQLTESLDCD